jgi:hypothetical protein
LIIDYKGDLVLSDLLTCVSYKDLSYNRAYTLIGTPTYIAPEVIS